jgi:mRNA interferase RelE/StbE
MGYSITILKRAQKELADLPKDEYFRVRDAIRCLGTDPKPHGCLKLSGRSGWRIRIGDYRVIYEIDDVQKKVTVVHVGDRKDVYR